MGHSNNTVVLTDSLLGRVAAVHNEKRGSFFSILEERFLLVHFGYITFLALAGAIYFCAAEGCTFVDGFFVAVSCVSCTGLTSIDVVHWSTTSTVIRHLLMVLGGAVFTSSYQPFFRSMSLGALYRRMTAANKRAGPRSRSIDDGIVDLEGSLISPNAPLLSNSSCKASYDSNEVVDNVFDDDDGEDDQRDRRDLIIAVGLLRDAAWVCFATPLLYCLVVQGTAIAVLAALNQSQMTFGMMLQRVVGSFQSCAFLSLEPFNQDPVTTLVLGWACAFGLTLCPVLFRGSIRIQYTFVRYFIGCRNYQWLRLAPPTSDTFDDTLTIVTDHSRIGINIDMSICECFSCRTQRAYCLLLNDVEALQISRPQQLGLAMNDNAASQRAPLFYSDDDILVLERLLQDTTKSPNYFHCFLFRLRNVVFLGVAFLVITFIQFAPFLWQQWDGVLAPFEATSQKLNVAWSQAMLTRFAGGQLIDPTGLLNGHLGIILLAMYLPALPFSMDESVLRDKFVKGKHHPIWKKTIWRVFTSRLMWLFCSSVTICLIDESGMRASLGNSHLDAWTRTVFEVVSGYSGSGLTLAIGGAAAPYSFSGSLSTASRVIITAVMFAGRHRAMGMRWVVEELDERVVSRHQR